MGVDGNVPAHHVRVGRVPARPDAIAQNYHVWSAVTVVARSKEAALSRLRAQQRQQVIGNPDHAYAFRLAFTSQVVIASNGHRNLLKSMVIVLDIEILRAGKPVPGNAQSGRGV